MRSVLSLASILVVLLAVAALNNFWPEWVVKLFVPPLKAPNDHGRTIIFHNAQVWTGDAQAPSAQAFAANANGILQKIGSNSDILSLASTKHQIIDLQGQHVVPGFVDAHLHLMMGAQTLESLDLNSVRSREELTRVVAAAVADKRPGEWIKGYGWQRSLLGGQLPSKQWLDAVTPDNPVFLTSMDMHLGLANSKALGMAGVGPSTQDPPGGAIHRDLSGQPTGILAEWAQSLIVDLIPEPDVSARQQLLHKASEYLLSRGVTTVHDMGRAPLDGPASWSDLRDVYIPAAERGLLPFRVFAFLPLAERKELRKFIDDHGWRDPSGRVFWGGLKDFSDGSLGASTALMHQPYMQDSSTCGMAVHDFAKLEQMVMEGNELGMQVAIHAIGDRAVDELLAIHDKLPAPSSPLGLPHRIEHAQHLSGSNATQLLSRLGLHAITNPQHLMTDSGIMLEQLGAERSGHGRSFAYSSMLQAGVKMAFGSDWPVVPVNPLMAAYVAANRHSPQPSGAAFTPSETISVADALTAQTSAGARAASIDDMIGSLRPGKHADFVVLHGNLNGLQAPGNLPSVAQTYVDGRCVYGCR
ncbi:hypothetical protein WJX74_011007 [Apatococcus lobatus]|uniref:Amidohydrolase 3 domain-containing protein n=1 Tax=Apatococcus lobatus TaxID=904363 RepID=A0AAW1RFM4_9CHLO